MASLTVPNRVESVRPATAFLVQAARAMKVPAAAEHVFEVAISEAITNAVKHGCSDRDDATITCDIELEDRQLTLRIIDGGQGFDLPKAEMPEVSPDKIESLSDSGYGLPIIQTVFPIMRVVKVDGRFGIELGLKY
ncbi:MAG TPA: ATP-binding protein [Vicinamibacterales bacterium]|nr:ATP-binding protein [Vicinamibacterales bacterium]